MKKSLLEIYALLVCLISLGVVVFTSVEILQSAVRIMHPSLDMSNYEYARYQSNDAYWEDKSSDNAAQSTACQHEVRPAEEQLSKQRNNQFQIELANIAHQSTKVLVDAVIKSMVFLFIFFLHWQMARRARKETAA